MLSLWLLAVLHRLAGRASLAHVLDCAARVTPRGCVLITVHSAMEVEAVMA